MRMNINDLISIFCALVLMVGAPVGTYQAYKFVRKEVFKQSQKGLPSLERFSRQLTKEN